jgi:hypothetical protein
MKENSVKFILMLFVVIVFFPGCSETKHYYYPTLENAEKGGALRVGLIPPVMPLSAKEIYVQIDIDTNNTWIKFNAKQSDLKTLSKKLRILTPRDAENPFPYWHPGWWKPTKKTKYSYIIAAYDYKFKWTGGKTDDKTGYFFLNIKNSIGYYYLPWIKR